MTQEKSFGIEVIADSSGKWVGNQVRLPTHEQALQYGRHKMATWMAVREVRVVAYGEPPNYTFEQGGLRDYSKVAQALTLDRQGGRKTL